MRQGDEEIFHRAESYVELHDPKRLPRLKVVEMGNGQLTEVRDEKKKGKYHRDKSVIGIAAQLQNSGSTNTVCLMPENMAYVRSLNRSDSMTATGSNTLLRPN